MPTSAVDYSFQKPTVAELTTAGVTDVFRYVGPASWGKTVTQTEYDSLVAAGIRVWLVFEAGANDSVGGFNAGVANARIALQNAPGGYAGPFFFAADEDLRGGALDMAVEYIRGASTVVGTERTGDYGPGALCQATHDAGIATFHWQSASTSFNDNAATLPITQVQQGLGGPLPGTDADSIVLPLIATPAPPAAPAPFPSPNTEESHMIASTPSGNGYWILHPDGSVWAYGDAQYCGGLNPGAPVGGGALPPGVTAISIESHPGGEGYWILSSIHAVYAFGAAAYHGAPAS